MPSLLLLCDAVVVVEAHELGVWQHIVDRHRVTLPRTVLEESRFYKDSRTGRREQLDLNPDVASGVIGILDAAIEELEAAAAGLDRVTIQVIDEGEMEALALLLCRRLPHRFCTGDLPAIRALCHLGLHDRGVSFERVLQEAGLTKPLKPHLTEETFRVHRDRGVAEWIQRRRVPQ